MLRSRAPYREFALRPLLMLLNALGIVWLAFELFDFERMHLRLPARALLNVLPFATAMLAVAWPRRPLLWVAALLNIAMAAVLVWFLVVLWDMERAALVRHLDGAIPVTALCMFNLVVLFLVGRREPGLEIARRIPK